MIVNIVAAVNRREIKTARAIIRALYVLAKYICTLILRAPKTGLMLRAK